ncbi:hypothetical protein EJ05DRAFT_504593 [Pseudovirgaria hyperparasitica]|uniref:Trichothecene 3-O-acetyltransferase-like N-terminal domain-containing protein n=1 Tax=Pseudovirgaria hyperparasitica TaxID=470096 RepID=A0A6A6VWH2_9PEZI|nr:uncharacterized protein EJ05DRAFT_504593 [Pseudovirgaria hyperparasitica]KAF2753990.1 hypothetical protein EJ05DRAFT_504593 [Pseudovirgaria hyperparasitica]
MQVVTPSRIGEELSPNANSWPHKPMKYLDLDALAQHKRINKLYTNLTFCFPLSDTSVHTQLSIQEALRRALTRRLCPAFPWLAGYVCDAGERPGEGQGRFAIKYDSYVPDQPLGSHLVDPHPRFISFPDWKELKRVQFCLPTAGLDERRFARFETFDESAGNVLGFAVVFVHGGLLLTVSAHHGSMDMAGLAWAMRMLGKALRNEKYSEEDLRVGNMSRKGLLEGFKENDESIEDSNVKDEGVTERTRPTETKTKVNDETKQTRLCWASFSFSASSLCMLKESASHDGVPSDRFISTDDVLSAFIWQAITRARTTRFTAHPSSLTTMLSRNIDMRRSFGVPLAYPGLLVTSTTTLLTFDKLFSAPLGAIAYILREALDPETLRRETRAQVDYIKAHNAPARKVGEITGLDVRLSSWAKEDCCEVDFGPEIGRPVAVRKLLLEAGAREGLVYFLPRGRDGEIVVDVCLTVGDMERMRMDREVERIAVMVGGMGVCGDT